MITYPAIQYCLFVTFADKHYEWRINPKINLKRNKLLKTKHVLLHPALIESLFHALAGA
jgi:hypothetical protein